MRLYVGQARGAALTRRLWLLGIGECTARGELPPRRHPWFYDNGAFGDWKKKQPFDREQFLQDLEAIYRSIDRPEFIVLPDIVAGGVASLKESRRWIHRCRGLAPLYLPVQDGMKPRDLDERLVGQLGGLFVGGTSIWKRHTGDAWVRAAGELGLRCHIGRVSGLRRVNWAKGIGADSIDSAVPLFSEGNLRCFLRGGERPAQTVLGLEEVA